jgi:CubicO group peptidase (beta-lactamase class C family)
MRKIAFLLFLLPFSGLTQNLDKIEQYIENARKDWNIPGVAVAIVKDDSLVFSKGFGLSNVNTNEKVDGNTMFAIASNTKAYTAACLAMLVDEGKISWDDRVIDHLPWFELYDPYVTMNATIRDLLSHRMGLATFSGDLIWYGTTHSREEVVRRAKYLKPVTGFRSEWGYSNIMYLAAGLIVEKVSGQRWDDFVKERIFKPLGMTRAVTSISGLRGMKNVAMPHNDVKGTNLTIEYVDWDNIAPAGSIITSVNDHARWIKMQLNGGVAYGKPLFNADQQHEMWKPHSIEEFSSFAQKLWPGKHFELYGLGWSIFDYYGYKVVSHGGGYDGMISQTVLVPELKLGFVVLTNNNNSLPYALMYKLLDEYIKPADRKDWSKVLLDFKKRREARQAEEAAKREKDRVKTAKPSLPIEKYAGKYACDAYGSVTVSVKNGALRVDFDHTPIYKGKLSHWHFDTFEIVLEGVHSLSPGTCRFNLNERGEPESLRIEIINPDFDFTEFDFKKVP